MIIKKCVMTGFFVLCTYWDLRYKKLPLWLLEAGLVSGVFFTCAEYGITGRAMVQFICGLIPGGCFCFLSWLFPDEIGIGDGCMIMAAGGMEGVWEVVFLLESGFLLLFPAALFWGVVKGRKKKELPFAPFLLGGYLGQLLQKMI